MKLELIMAIVIPCIVIVGTVILHLVEFFQKDNVPCKVWAEQWDDEDVMEHIKTDLIKQENEELRRAIKLTSCTSKQYEEEIQRMKEALYAPMVVPRELIEPEILTIEKAKELGLDDLDEEEPKSKKLQPLICKMCGGTVAKKGDNYECEYCGLRYEWR